MKLEKETLEMKAKAHDTLLDVLYHFDVDMYADCLGSSKAVYYVRLWQESDEKGEVEAPTLVEAMTLALELAKRLVFPSDDEPPSLKPPRPELRISHEGLSLAERESLDRALNSIFEFDVGVMPLREYLARFDFHRKSRFVRQYSRKRYRLEYKRLKHPVIEYTLWHLVDGKELGVKVPKIVWNAVPDVPEITYEQWFDAQT